LTVTKLAKLVAHSTGSMPKVVGFCVYPKADTISLIPLAAYIFFKLVRI
jgi:hypothetical protein